MRSFDGVSIPTLYAYVSRGLLRSEAGSRRRRTRRYRADDIARLKARKEARHDPGAAARKTLTWGMPVLDSAITLVADGRLYLTHGGDLWWGKHQGWLKCLDPAAGGDVTRSPLLWSYPMSRETCSTPAVSQGLVIRLGMRMDRPIVR